MQWADGSNYTLISQEAISDQTLKIINYKGYWLNGVPHGKGKMTYTDGTSKLGLFENNLLTKELHDINQIEEVSELHEVDNDLTIRSSLKKNK